MGLLESFPDITKRREPLAPYTHLRIGGPAEFFVQPRTLEELKGVLAFCTTNKVPLRMLGGGFNLAVQGQDQDLRQFLGETLADAISNVYRCAEPIRFEGLQVRSDIGRKGLKRW